MARRPSLLQNIRLKNIAQKIKGEFTPAEQAADFQGDIRRGLGRQSTMLGGNITALGDEQEDTVNRLPISIDDAGLPQVNPDFDLTSIGIGSEISSRVDDKLSPFPQLSFFQRVLRGGREKKIKDIENRAESVTAFQKRLSASSLGRRSTTNRRANLLRSQFDEEDLRLGVL